MARGWLVLGVLGLAACDAASSDPALDSVLAIAGAQYRPGAFPIDDGGPAARSLATRHPNNLIDRVTERANASHDPTPRAAVFGIEGYEGAWIVPAGPPDFSAPGMPTANIVFGVRAPIEVGPFTLRVAAADAEGRFGAAAEAMLVADDEPEPSGPLAIRLVWEGEADLDLHVVDALGGEAYAEKPSTMPAPVPGEPVDPTAFQKYGSLDHDGNKACRRDGRPRETIAWTMPPPAGEYVVRVDARSMCGAPGQPWAVMAYRNGELVGGARGFAAPADVRGDAADPLGEHGLGAGVLALRFSL